MIYKSLIFLCLISLNNILYSQTTTLSPWNGGLVVAGNLSNYSKEYNNAALGFDFGGFVDYKIDEKMFLNAELRYSNKNSFISTTYFIYENNQLVDSFSLRPKVTTGSLNLPLLFNYYFYKNFYVSAGPQMSFLLHSKFNDKFNDKNVIYPDKNQMNDFVLYGNLGLGYKISDQIRLNLRYEKGLSKSIQDFDKTSNAYTLNLYYSF